MSVGDCGELVPAPVYVLPLTGVRIRRLKGPPEASAMRQRTTVPSTGENTTAPGSVREGFAMVIGLPKPAELNAAVSGLPMVTGTASAPAAERPKTTSANVMTRATAVRLI